MSQRKKWLFFSIGLLLLNIGLFTYLLNMGPPLPFYRQETQVGVKVKPLQVTEKTAVYLQDGYDLCHEAHLDCSEPSILKGSARQKLNGLNYNEITDMYPKGENWSVDTDSQNATILIHRLREGLCPLHSSYYHFEAVSGNIAAYYGPAAVGKAAGLAFDTGISLDLLPEALTNKILLGQWEFKSWDELQAVIDTLDES